MHGGPGGNFFSKSLYNAIAFNSNFRLTYEEDIADKDVCDKVALVYSDTVSLLNCGHGKSQDTAVHHRILIFYTL